MHADVIIIGTGQAGVPLATRLAQAGKRVRVAERGNAGGTCVNVGCTPIDPKTERILGAALVGAEAGESIRIFVSLMEAQASARAIVDAEYVHPTFAEGVQSLVMRLKRFTLS